MIHSSKINKLIDALSDFTKQDIIKIETNDPQFLALKKLYKKIENPDKFIKLVIINALLSYQLQTTGEIYWENFSLFFSDSSKEPNDFYDFISLYNKRLINLRKKRLAKILNCIENLNDNFFHWAKSDLTMLQKYLCNCLKQKPDAKTIVFSLKMYLYATDIIENKHHFSPFGIMIPMDSRIKKISSDKNFWYSLEKKTSIPLLHIDSILWMSLSGHFNISDKKIEKVKTILLDVI